MSTENLNLNLKRLLEVPPALDDQVCGWTDVLRSKQLSFGGVKPRKEGETELLLEAASKESPRLEENASAGSSESTSFRWKTSLFSPAVQEFLPFLCENLQEISSSEENQSAKLQQHGEESRPCVRRKPKKAWPGHDR